MSHRRTGVTFFLSFNFPAFFWAHSLPPTWHSEEKRSTRETGGEERSELYLTRSKQIEENAKQKDF